MGSRATVRKGPLLPDPLDGLWTADRLQRDLVSPARRFVCFASVPGYVGQANIAYGSQQVNNAASEPEGSHAREKSIAPSKLLEEAHDERVDSRATGAAGENDPPMETVARCDRAKDA